MHKVISIFLSFLLLTSATGIAYGQHFCGGNLAKSMLVLSAVSLNCGMEMNKTPATCELEKETATDLHNDSCCDNELHQVETDDHFSGSQFEFDFHTDFFVAFVSVFVLPSPEKIKEDIGIFNYSPPPIPIKSDLLVLYQTFLI